MNEIINHPLRVGDILKSLWGYDQTNVDYYQVTRLVGRTQVEITPLVQNKVYTGAMTGKVSPIMNQFDGPPMRKRPSKEGNIRLTSYSYASPCRIDDQAYFSEYA